LDAWGLLPSRARISDKDADFMQKAYGHSKRRKDFSRRRRESQGVEADAIIPKDVPEGHSETKN